MLAHRILGGCSCHFSISCPSLVSMLIAVAHAYIRSLFRWCSESPLLAHLETMVSATEAVPDFFLDFFLVSCGALAPFRLCSRSQPLSSPWDLNSEARASAPCPHPPQRVSTQASQAGEYWSALILCVGISLLCSLHPCCCALLYGSKVSSPPTPHVCQ